MGKTYRCSTCLKEFSRSDSLRRHLNSGICQQEMEENDDVSEQDDDIEEDDVTDESDVDLSVEKEHGQKTEPWDTLMNQVYDSMQDTFNERVDNILQHNKDIQLRDAENAAYVNLKPEYRRSLINNYQNLLKLVSHMKLDAIHKKYYKRQKLYVKTKTSTIWNRYNMQ